MAFDVAEYRSTMNLTALEAETPIAVPAVIEPMPAPADAAPVLSWSMLAAILGGLAGVSATIVAVALLAVWLMRAPPVAPTVVEPPPQLAAVGLPPPPAPVEMPSAAPPAAAVEPDDMPPLPLPRDTIKLARRMPTGAPAPDDMPPPMPPGPPGAKAPEPELTAKTPPATPPVAKGRINWMLESAAPAKRDNTNLIVPIEVARIEDENLLYTLRRLRFDEPKPLKLAVTPFVHDDVGSLLKTMGPGYRYTTLQKEDIFALPVLRNFDVVFLTCADIFVQDYQAALPLRRYVEGGGTLYASDLRGELVAAAFPEFRRTLPLLPGVAQSVEAQVVDAGLEAYLGRKAIPLAFDVPNWRPAAFDASKATVCLKGTYRNLKGDVATAPLLVKFRAGKGTVVFTSFHHSKNDGAIVQKLLEYLVFSSVAARSEARVKELMLRSQFAAEDLRPAFVSPGKNAEGTCRHQGGALQIALGFENQGAKLKLTLRSPSGKMVEHEDQGLYLIELPNAEAGVWHYTVTPIEVPNANFAILVAVGKPKS